MDESLKVPYYFPPQRYIPRLGGMGGGGRGGWESPVDAGFQGLAQAMEMYAQLQQAKELKQEREKDKMTLATQRQEDKEEREQDRQEHRREVLTDRGERRELGEEERLQKAGIVYD